MKKALALILVALMLFLAVGCTVKEDDHVNFSVDTDGGKSNILTGLIENPSGGSYVVSYDADSWNYEVVAELDDVLPDNYAAISSDGKKLAYTTWDNGYVRRYLVVVDTETGERTEFFKDIPYRVEIIKISWIPESYKIIYIRNDTNYNRYQTIEMLDAESGEVNIIKKGEVWQIRTVTLPGEEIEPFYQPGNDSYLPVIYDDNDGSEKEYWSYYLSTEDLEKIYTEYGGVRDFDFETIRVRMYVEFSAPRCSFDGRYIAFSAKLTQISAPGFNTPLWICAAIWVYDIESGESNIIYKQADKGCLGRVDWISNNELAFVSYYGAQGGCDDINYINIRTNEVKILFSHTAEHYNNVTLLPISNSKVSFTSSKENDIYENSLTYVLDPLTGEIVQKNILFDNKPVILENFIFEKRIGKLPDNAER